MSTDGINIGAPRPDLPGYFMPLPSATCGVCDWRLEGTDFEVVKAEGYKHWESAHPKEWADWMQAQRNAHYFLTGEGSAEVPINDGDES